MISVFLMILKVIGIVLLTILLLILFLIGLILFVPVHYSVKGTIDNNFEAEGKICWLFSILKYSFLFQENEFDGTFRIFGIRIHKKEAVTEEELEEDVTDEAEDAASDAIRAMELEQTDRKEPARKTSDNASEQKKASSRRKKTSRERKKKDENFFLRIKQKYKDTKDKFLALKNIVTDKKNQYVVKKIWKELLYLLKHFGFRKIKTNLTFSLADPALTGQVLGIICMMPFLYQYEFGLYPDFESEQYYLKGTYDIRGRIRIVHILLTVIRLLLDKQVRTFITKLLNNKDTE